MCSPGNEFDFCHGDATQRCVSQVLAMLPVENAEPQWHAGAPPCLLVGYSHLWISRVDAVRLKMSE